MKTLLYSWYTEPADWVANARVLTWSLLLWVSCYCWTVGEREGVRKGGSEEGREWGREGREGVRMGREGGRKRGREGGERRGSRKTVRKKRQAKGEYHWQFKVLVSVGRYLETVQPFLLQAQQTIHTHTQPLFPSTCTQTKYSQHSHFLNYTGSTQKEVFMRSLGLVLGHPVVLNLALNPGFPFQILSHSFGEKSDFSPKLWDKIWNGKLGFEAKFTLRSSPHSRCPKPISQISRYTEAAETWATTVWQ